MRRFLSLIVMAIGASGILWGLPSLADLIDATAALASVRAGLSPSSPTAPPLAGCLSGQVDSITYSVAAMSYGQPDTVSIGGTLLCPTCDVQAPLAREFAIRLERAIERGLTVQACYDAKGVVSQLTLFHP